ncbi:MAG TPA: F0F1 ATP synthase subunit delta [Candidatus Saccharimonadales bacterium]|nr:F0F1 ATP synthase subunit delta [Candidatus Saccharimonadales bacterium]
MNRKVSRRTLARVVAEKLLAEPTRAKHWLQATAAYLLEHKMVDDADLLINDIARELFAQDGRLMVHVASARPLSESIRAELKTFLRETTNAKHVELAESLDKDLLGGLVARTPDAELDLSVRRRLRQLASITAA